MPWTCASQSVSQLVDIKRGRSQSQIKSNDEINENKLKKNEGKKKIIKIPKFFDSTYFYNEYMVITN